MAQGDTFTDGADGSTAGSTTDTIDVTAASGNHVSLHDLGVSSPNTNVDSRIESRDTGSSTTWTTSSNPLAWVSANDTADTFKGANIFIDDTVGVRVTFDNTGCSSNNRSYAIHGQQVK